MLYCRCNLVGSVDFVDERAKMDLQKFLFGMLISVAVVSGHASDYGCKVLLCLANPNGPMAVSECVPPISQLYRDLARGRSFPTCDLAQGPNGISYARPGYSYYNRCPEGTRELAQGAYAIQGASVPQSSYFQQYDGQPYTGIGAGDGLQPGAGDGYSPMPGKVCVGNKVGSMMITQGSGDSQSTYNADVFDNVVIMDPQSTPNIIDVFIDDKLYRRVRW
jgi:hypothetical protein